MAGKIILLVIVGIILLFSGFQNSEAQVSSGDFIVINGDSLIQVTPSGVQTLISSGGLLAAPAGVAIDASGDFIVTDLTNDSIVRVTPSGVQTLISSGGLLAAPAGVAIDASGDFIVTDLTNDSIVRVTPSGVQTLISSGGLLENPDSIVIDASGDYIVLLNSSIVRVTPSGVQTLIWTGNILSSQTAMTIDASGDFIITSKPADTLIRVTPTGFQTLISAVSLLSIPEGVAVDANGDIIVTDSAFDSIFRVNTAGVQTLISTGGLLTSPTGMAIVLAGNQQPIVTITTPPDSSNFAENQLIPFTGTVIDTEDGDISSSLQWNSDVDGIIGTGASISSSLSLGIHTITASVTDSAGASGFDVITVDVTINALPYNLPVKIENPEPYRNDLFGFFNNGVDIDGNLVLVGAAANSNTAIGAAYLYDCSTDPCVLLDSLTYPNPEPLDLFGYGVGLSGSMVVVGAYQDDPGSVNDAGSVYVYDCAASIAAGDGSVACSTPIEIQNPLPNDGDRFGYAVDIDGNTVAIATDGDLDATAFVYDCTVNSCTLKDQVNDLPPVSFNVAIAVSGGGVVVGEVPRVFYYDCSGPTCSPGIELIDPNIQTRDQFGFSVDISGDHVVVGDNGFRIGSGSAFVFECNLGSCTLDTELINPEPDTGDRFGYGISIDGNNVIVGAWENHGRAGSAYLYDFQSGNLLNTFDSPVPLEQDYFGSDVAISGTNLIIGADHFDVNFIRDAGSAYFYSIVTDPPPDADGDGVSDSTDNCLTVPNASQEDTNGDRTGDACEVTQAQLDQALAAVPAALAQRDAILTTLFEFLRVFGVI